MMYLFICYLVRTCGAAVISSIPEPPEAKHTPVGRSEVCNLPPRYAGNVSLTPKAEAKQHNR